MDAPDSSKNFFENCLNPCPYPDFRYAKDFNQAIINQLVKRKSDNDQRQFIKELTKLEYINASEYFEDHIFDDKYQSLQFEDILNSFNNQISRYINEFRYNHYFNRYDPQNTQKLLKYHIDKISDPNLLFYSYNLFGLFFIIDKTQFVDASIVNRILLRNIVNKPIYDKLIIEFMSLYTEMNGSADIISLIENWNRSFTNKNNIDDTPNLINNNLIPILLKIKTILLEEPDSLLLFPDANGEQLYIVDIYNIEILSYLIMLHQFYKQQGYIFHYFSYLDPNNIYYQALKMDLTPENFDSIAISTYQNYMNVITKYINNRPIYKIKKESKKLPIPRCLGWSRKKISDAISKLGYPSYSDDLFLPVSAISENQKGTVLIVIKWSDRSDKDIYPYDKLFYETIYRSLFRTSQYLDWQNICDNKLFSEDLLKFIATYDFRRYLTQENKDYIMSLNKNQICQEIINMLGRDKVKKLLSSDLQDIYHDFIYQPGGRLMPEGQGFADVNIVENLRLAYRDIYNICGAIESGALGREAIYELIIDEDLAGLFDRNIKLYNVDEICSILKKYAKLLEAGR